MANLELCVNDEWDKGLTVTNENLPIMGMKCIADFLDDVQIKQMIDQISDQEFTWEGFHQRRRVQRYQLDGEGQVPPSFIELARQLKESHGWDASHVSVEEYERLKWRKQGDFASQWAVTTFESNAVVDDASCFVGIIPLNKMAEIHMNKPMKREAQCWRLESELHQTDMFLERGSLLIKSGDSLWNWRSRTSADAADDKPVLIVKLYRLPTEPAVTETGDAFGNIPRPRDELPRGDMPPWTAP